MRVCGMGHSGIFPDGETSFRVLDSVGNVFEWCLNDYRNPQIMEGYGNGECKLLWGGFFDDFQIATASSRSLDHPRSDSDYYGFRLVLGAHNPLTPQRAVSLLPKVPGDYGFPVAARAAG